MNREYICDHCGRVFPAEDGPLDSCPSDDCPSHDNAKIGHWYLNEDTQELHVITDDSDEDLHGEYHGKHLADVDPHAVAKRHGLYFVPEWQRRGNETDGYYIA